MFVRYEDFTADPSGVMRQVLDMADSSAPIPDLTALKTGQAIGGNRLLHAEQVAPRPEPAPTRVSGAP